MEGYGDQEGKGGVEKYKKIINNNIYSFIFKNQITNMIININIIKMYQT